MKRLHIHVAVEHLQDSIAFYQALFAAPPTVVKPDYAKWMLDDPRVNFAISQRGAKVGLDHLGIQVESAEELAEMHARLQTLPVAIAPETGAACCYAKADKYWVTDRQGIAWETFHTLATIPMFGSDRGEAPATPAPATSDAGCCVPLATVEAGAACCAPAAAPSAKGCC